MYNIKLTLWKNKQELFIVSHKAKMTAKIEIEAFLSRIKKGEATHITVEALSEQGTQWLQELRNLSS